MVTISRTLLSKSVKWMGLFKPICRGPITSTSGDMYWMSLLAMLALDRLGNTNVFTSFPRKRVKVTHLDGKTRTTRWGYAQHHIAINIADGLYDDMKLLR